MADKEKNQQTEETKKKKKSKLMLLLIIGFGLLIAGGSGAGVVFFMGSGDESAEGMSADGTPAESANTSTDQVVLSFDTFVVNLSDTNKDRFMKVTMRAVVNDAELESRINSEPLLKARTRDRILSVLSSKSFAEVTSPTGKETLRREMARELNQILPPGSVQEILFAELIIQ